MTFPAHFDHASLAGWATYHARRPWTLWRVICEWRGHVLPDPPPSEQRNGRSPSCYAKCPRCRASLKWFVVGQHRWGGLDSFR